MIHETATFGCVADRIRAAAAHLADASAYKKSVSTYTLRDDQQNVFQDLAEYIKTAVNINEIGERLPMGRIILPPRTGKTVVAGEAIAAGRTNATFITTTLALVDQTIDDFRAMLPDVPIGIFTGDEKRLVTNGVNVSNYSVLQNQMKLHGELPPELRHSSFIFADEAHHSMTPQRLKLLREGFDKYSVRIALTATPDYSEERTLARFFPDLIHEITMGEAIQLDLLAPVRIWLYEVDVDASAVRMFAGEYEENALADLMSSAPFFSAAETLRFAEDAVGKQALICCKTRQQAYDLLAYLRERRPEYADGIRIVVGDTPKNERREILKAYERGEVHTLISVAVLLEGWSSKQCKLLIDLAPAASPVRATQKFFRPMTKWEDREAHIYLIVPKHLPVPPVMPMELMGWQESDYESGTLITSPNALRRHPKPAAQKHRAPRTGIASVQLQTRIITQLRFEKPKLDPKNWEQVRRVVFSNNGFDVERTVPGVHEFRWMFFRHDLYTGGGLQLLRYLGIGADGARYATFLAMLFPNFPIDRWPQKPQDLQGFRERLTRFRQRGTAPIVTFDIPSDGDYLQEPIPTPEEALIEKERRVLLETYLSRPGHTDDLSPKERQILEWRYGLNDTESHTLDEVGTLLGISRERTRQYESRAIQKVLRHLYNFEKYGS